MAASDQQVRTGLSSHIANLYNANVIVGDNTMIVTNPATSAPPPSTIWFNVQDPIGSFFERKGFLPKLQESLHAQEKECTVLSRIKIIFGLGGIGKTQMARKYIQKYKTQYVHVVWVNAETQNSMTMSFSKLAQYLNVPITRGDKDRDVDDIVKDCYNIICLKKSLIVFDNAEHHGDKKSKIQNGIKTFLPSALSANLAPPFVLVTSRNRDWASLSCHVVPMELFNDSECIEFILGQLPSEKNCEDDASELGRIMDGLILALQQAIAYIREEDENRRWSSGEKFGVKGYIAAFGEKRNDLLNHPSSDSDYDATVATTWRMTLDKIQQVEVGGDLVKEICEIMAFLSPDGVPIKLIFDIMKHGNVQQNPFSKLWKLFHSFFVSREKFSRNRSSLVSPEHPDTGQIQIGNGMRQLNRYALIEMSNDSNLVSMHRLVQDVILESVKEAGRVEAILNRLVDGCGDMVDNLGYNFEDCGDLFSNFLNIVDKFALAEPKRKFLLFQNKLGRQYFDMGKYEEAIDMFEQVWENRKKILGLDHPDSLTTQANIALVILLQGRSQESLNLNKHVFSILKKLWGSEDSNLLAVKNNMAIALHQLGRYEEAMKMYEEVSQVRKIRLGAEHPDLLTTQYNMAFLLQRQGKYKEAMKIFEHVFEIRERVLGSQHPHVLYTQIGIAVNHEHEGKFVKAMEMYEQVLKIKKKILSPDHPRLLYAQAGIANMYRRKGRLKEAMEIFEEISKLGENVLNPEHHSLIDVQCLMALALERQKRIVEAMNILEHVVATQIKIYDPDHPDLLLTQIAMALVLVGQQKFDKAIQIYGKVFEIQREKLGQEHHNFLGTQNNLAFALYDHGRQKEAIDILTNVVKIWGKSEYPEHPDLVQAQTVLTDWLSNFDAQA